MFKELKNIKKADQKVVINDLLSQPLLCYRKFEIFDASWCLASGVLRFFHKLTILMIKPVNEVVYDSI